MKFIKNSQQNTFFSLKCLCKERRQRTDEKMFWLKREKRDYHNKQKIW